MAIHITEPATLLTDYALAGVTLFLGVSLARIARAEQQNSIGLWAGAFLASGFAALAGGTWHGFALHLGASALWLLWKSTLYAIGLASFCMLAGSVFATVRLPPRFWLLIVCAAKLLVYVVWMATHDEFRYVIFDYAPAMLAVCLLHAGDFLAGRRAAASWMIAGVGTSFLAAGIQLSGFSLHPGFNHNDLYHVVQIAAFLLLFRGARRLRDAS